MNDKDLEELERSTEMLNMFTTALNVATGISCLSASIVLFKLAFDGESPIVYSCGGVVNLILVSVCIYQILTRND
jgi:hypothetical protein